MIKRPEQAIKKPFPWVCLGRWDRTISTTHNFVMKNVIEVTLFKVSKKPPTLI